MSIAKAPEKRRRAMTKQELAPEPAHRTPRLKPVYESQPAQPGIPWYATATALSLVSSVLLYAAFPPLNMTLLAWLAPLGWLVLIRAERMPGKRPYLAVWLTSLAFWLALLHFVRLPHWSAYFGWLALGLYLSCYGPLFVGLSRVAVHRLRLPLVIAAPAVWTGLELLRSHLFTGFSIALLGHTQVRFPRLIQIADVCGAYGVSFIIMLVAACIVCILPLAARKSPLVGRWSLWPALPLAGALCITLAYGNYRLSETLPGAADGKVVRVGLIQGCFPTKFEDDYKTASERALENFDDYVKQTVKVCQRHPELDVVIWPESMFITFNEPDLAIEGDVADIEPPRGEEDPEIFREHVKNRRENFPSKARDVAFRINHASGKKGPVGNTSLLVGCETTGLGPHRPQRYNSALLIDPAGEVTGRYYKMHRVMFGEYVPLGNLLPWLYSLTPMSEGLTAGQQAQEFEVAGLRLAPSICFETTVPHVIRRQVLDLGRDGAPPDVLVNVTNDGWFWGREALDLHLTCGIFRAVEQRRPLLIAANTGFSAHIDGNGRVLEQGPRYATGEIVANVMADGRHSPYLVVGDLPAWACSLLVCLSAVVGLWGRFGKRVSDGVPASAGAKTR